MKLSLPLILRHACPSCGSERVGRLHRRTSRDWVLSAFGLRPFCCGDCQRKFHAVPALRGLAVSSRERRVMERRAPKQKAKTLA